MASQSPAAKCAKKRSPTWLAAFSSRGTGRLSSSNLAMRGVEVRLVEYLGAIDQFAVNRENLDPTPLGVKALLRGPVGRVSDDCSEVGQPMHGLDIDTDVLVELQPRAEVWVRSPGPNAVPRRWSMLTQSGVVNGRSCRLIAA